MILPDFDPAAGLWGLGLYSLLAATLLPGGSELALYLMVRQQPDLLFAALGVATIGNTLGGMISWWCGRVLPRWQKLDGPPRQAALRRWGSPLLLLAWLPVVGDALCVAAGWLRLHWLPCCVFMAVGKFARYWVIAQAATG